MVTLIFLYYCLSVVLTIKEIIRGDIKSVGYYFIRAFELINFFFDIIIMVNQVVLVERIDNARIDLENISTKIREEIGDKILKIMH